MTHEDTYHLPDDLWMVVIDSMPEEPDFGAVKLFEWQHPDTDFYWPSKKRIYRSRSSAQDRLALFERYGATGHLVHASPDWERSETKDQKIARLEDEVRLLAS